MYERLTEIAVHEFGEIVTHTEVIGRRAGAPLKLRLHIRDGTYADIWVSPNLQRYAYHWEQRAVRGLIHRHDNAPDHPEIGTFPKHFHNGSEEQIEASAIADDPPSALREFLTFIKSSLKRD
jgi:hypothetical protein